jgi:hypothetical protein
VIIFLVIGAGLQAVGLVLAGLGFRITWREHAAGEDFWQPYKDGLGRVAQRADARLRKLLRRPARVNRAEGGSVALVVAVGEGYGYAPFTKLPDPATDMAAFTAEVDDRLGRLLAMIHEDRVALRRETKAREEADQQQDTELGDEIGRTIMLTQRVAVGGLHLELHGWLLLFIGLIFTSIGSIGLALD